MFVVANESKKCQLSAETYSGNFLKEMKVILLIRSI